MSNTKKHTPKPIESLVWHAQQLSQEQQIKLCLAILDPHTSPPGNNIVKLLKVVKLLRELVIH